MFMYDITMNLLKSKWGKIIVISNMHSDFKLESILRLKPLLNNLNISKLNLHIKSILVLSRVKPN